MARTTVAQRRQRTMILTVLVTAGASFTLGIVVAVWSCANLPQIVSSLAHSAWIIGLVFLVVWFARALIAAFIATLAEWPEQRRINIILTGKSHFWS